MVCFVIMQTICEDASSFQTAWHQGLIIFDNLIKKLKEPRKQISENSHNNLMLALHKNV